MKTGDRIMFRPDKARRVGRRFSHGVPVQVVARNFPMCWVKHLPRIESKSTMNKRQLIDDIRRINTTVQPRFLAQFDEEALKQYLTHLRDAQDKRLRIGGWVRRQPRLRLVS